VLSRDWPAGSEEARTALVPRDGVVAERCAGPRTFEQETGPFTSYRRTVDVVHAADGEVSVHETTRYQLDIPWFGWLFARPMRAALAHPATARRTDAVVVATRPLDRRQARLLGLLAAASISAAFANTLFTQTVNFAADSFGISETGQAVGGVIVRVGVVIAVPFAVLADRLGRRRMIVLTSWLAPIFCFFGAASPNFWVLVGTQSVGRPLGLALALLIGVAAAEEMPRNSRAYALSVLAMASGIGAGVAVISLRLADLG
jgi:RsiW-degrading membrane proteinase PrsW (M82 family)